MISGLPVTRCEGWLASESPQLIALRHAGYTGAHLKSYRDEPGPLEIIEDNRKTLVKYFKGIRICFSKKVTHAAAHLK